ncbi:MAG: hypothetical protein M3R65_01210 [Gemmatimonadota bacterium]|nr:hypothetical protein [Gemmatimonadota bacterium]
MIYRSAVVSACFAVCLTAGLACAHPHGNSEPQPEAVALEVENHNWSDIVIYVVHDGSTHRFMSIGAARSLTVALEPRFISSDGNVRFIAHRVGGQDDYYSPSVSVRTGATVALTLQPELNMSSIGVW